MHRSIAVEREIIKYEESKREEEEKDRLDGVGGYGSIRGFTSRSRRIKLIGLRDGLNRRMTIFVFVSLYGL